MLKSFYVIRHGETDWNKKNVFQGHRDIPLNDKGIEQATKLKEQLTLEDNAMIFSSPLIRAHKTAQIATDFHPDIVLLPEFMECNSPEGAKYLLSLKKATQLPDFSFLDQNGESVEELLERVREGLEKMSAMSEDKTPYLFAHGGICTAICQVLKVDFFRTPNCGIFHFEYNDNNFTAHTLN